MGWKVSKITASGLSLGFVYLEFLSAYRAADCALPEDPNSAAFISKLSPPDTMKESHMSLETAARFRLI